MKKLLIILSVLIGILQAQTLVVGGKNFTEQQFLAEMTTQLLKKKGFDVEKKNGMGSTVLRKAQIHGQIDIYWEYTGTSLITYNKIKEKLNAQGVYSKVKQLDKKVGLIWLKPSRANNTYALAMRKEDIDKYGIKTISDYAKAMKNKENLKTGLNSEFSARADGMPGVQKVYKFRLPRKNLIKMDTGLIYSALKNKKIDVGVVFATDGRIKAFNFYTLKDDKDFFPSYELAPVVREDILKKYPKLEEILNKVSLILTNKIMRKINSEIDVEKIPVKDVAHKFLKENGLI